MIFRYLYRRKILQILKRHVSEENVQHLAMSMNDISEWKAFCYLIAPIRRRIFGFSASDISTLQSIQAACEKALAEPLQQSKKCELGTKGTTSAE